MKDNHDETANEIVEEVEQQVKSKERVADFGEVFTNKREVNAMLDLVKDESYKVDSRFLESACGTGNFLVEILDRKMKTVMNEHNVDQADFEKHTFIAISSIYAIDIQEDNCQESRARMFNIVKEYYDEAYPVSQDDQFLKTIEYILELNVILGNGLSGLQVDSVNQDDIKSKPIEFSEFTMNGDMTVRKDFEMNSMIKHNNKVADNEAKMNEEAPNLFNTNTIAQEKEVLKPIREFEETNFKEVYKYGKDK